MAKLPDKMQCPRCKILKPMLIDLNKCFMCGDSGWIKVKWKVNYIKVNHIKGKK